MNATLPAGRELDREIAVRVFGRHATHPPQSSPGFWLEWTAGEPETDGAEARELPRYSSDIRAAWEVVKKARGRFSLWAAFTTALQHDVSTSFGLRPGEYVGPDFVWRLAEPEHICRAALAAVSTQPGGVEQ